MDKAEFVTKAPIYYMLAIGQAFDRVSVLAQTKESISKRIGGGLTNDALFNAAVRMLRDRGVITVEHDDFGPAVYRTTDSFSDWWHSRASKESEIAGRMFDFFMEDRSEWLEQALSRVNNEASLHWLRDEDFAGDAPDGWDPIPLDRSDDTLKTAAAKIDEAIEQIEVSNGYAATAPGERNYVLNQLKTFSTYLKTEAQITWMEVKAFALEPLGLAIKRFAGAAAGIASEAARQALLDWLKRTVPKLVEWFIS